MKSIFFASIFSSLLISSIALAEPTKSTEVNMELPSPFSFAMNPQTFENVCFSLNDKAEEGVTFSVETKNTTALLTKYCVNNANGSYVAAKWGTSIKVEQFDMAFLFPSMVNAYDFLGTFIEDYKKDYTGTTFKNGVVLFHLENNYAMVSFISTPMINRVKNIVEVIAQ